MERKRTIKVLLVCGILSPVLYAIADVTAGILWQGYSFRDQAISELGAIGAPSSLIFSVFLVVVYALITAFGIGVWKISQNQRKLKIVGGLLITLGILALTVGMFVPMQMRGAEQGLSGALHLIDGGISMVLIFTSMGIAATIFGTVFRNYTISALIIAFTFGAWSGMDAPLIEQGLATPWLGVKERIFWYVYQSWYIVFSIVLIRNKLNNSLHLQKN